jgi:hypothetical protein
MLQAWQIKITIPKKAWACSFFSSQAGQLNWLARLKLLISTIKNAQNRHPFRDIDAKVGNFHGTATCVPAFGKLPSSVHAELLLHMHPLKRCVPACFKSP